MSKLDELIQEHCPNGVEMVALGDIGIFYGGLTGKTKEDFEKGNAKFVTYKNVFMNIAVNISELAEVSVLPSEKQNSLQFGDIIFTGSSEIINECGMSSVVVNRLNETIYLNSFCFGFRLNNTKLLKPDFCKFLFRSDDIRKKIIKTANGVTRFNISKEKMKKIQIPLPPLPVQEEIARILDLFSAYTAELSEELSAELLLRKKQYQYYRDHLLTFDLGLGGGVKIVKLADVGTDFYRGNGIKRTDLTTEGTPCVRYGEIYTTHPLYFDKCVSYVLEESISNPKHINYGDVLFAITGESVAEIGKATTYLGKEKALVGGDILVMKHEQNPKYLVYVLSTEEVRRQQQKGKIKSKVVHTNADGIKNITIPLPPLAVQERIVEVLDNFETVCNDLNIGLPAEIEARKKQYEFYRDGLLRYVATGRIMFADSGQRTADSGQRTAT